jgi:DNA-binding IclR family transcriptional regulator
MLKILTSKSYLAKNKSGKYILGSRIFTMAVEFVHGALNEDIIMKIVFDLKNHAVALYILIRF